MIDNINLCKQLDWRTFVPHSLSFLLVSTSQKISELLFTLTLGY